MSEPIPLTAAVTGLLPLVDEGFIIARDVFVGDKKLRLFLGRVELQKAFFQSWKERWTDHLGRLSDSKLREFVLNKPILARGVLKQLVSLLKTLSDADKLKRKYGVKVEKLPSKVKRGEDVPASLKYYSEYLSTVDSRFTIKDLPSFDKSRANHLSLLKELRFVAVGKDHDLQELIGRLEDLNQELQLLSSTEAIDDSARRLYEISIRDIAKDSDRVLRLAEAAAYEAKTAIDPTTKAQLDNLTKFINFAMAIKGASAGMSSKKLFSRRDFSFDAPYKLGPNSTLARLFDYPVKGSTRLVLVEWITVSKPTAIKAKLDELKIEWFVLHADKPDGLLLPTSLGLIYDDSDPKTIGIIFQLPSYIRTESVPKPVLGRPAAPIVRSPKTIAAQRMPTNLRDLIQKHSPLNLGIRFNLAKKLLESVYLMHTAGWIHRKIRPDNILLFPSLSPETSEPDPTHLDYLSPFLSGFHSTPLEIQVPSIPFDPPKQLEHIRQLQPLTKILSNATRVITLDAYQHPDHRKNVDAPYRAQFDLFGLGCILLELGLWDTIENLDKKDISVRGYHPGVVPKVEDIEKDGETVRRATRGLDSVTGSIYAEVVRELLAQKPVSGDILAFERQLVGKLAQIEA
ncbi:hypothetical protein QBC38DRAFT_392697 [Podospora fimiseda]|uniref:Protein kinase domain-containing protein n=1 Tax=Podospora fimiseda TaxID=252190 RepID=A0AAN7GTP2_9PEZI|nr:hypothetical protein QBC38DRAFT_392697 [Podospora fimiseda]